LEDFQSGLRKLAQDDTSTVFLTTLMTIGAGSLCEGAGTMVGGRPGPGGGNRCLLTGSPANSYSCQR